MPRLSTELESCNISVSQPPSAEAAVLHVQAQTASLVYRHKGEDYLLNLIDTPGHVGACSTVATHSVLVTMHGTISPCKGIVGCWGRLLHCHALALIQGQSTWTWHAI